MATRRLRPSLGRAHIGVAMGSDSNVASPSARTPPGREGHPALQPVLGVRRSGSPELAAMVAVAATLLLADSIQVRL